MKVSIHKRVAYIKPKPKEYIKNGLVLVLNKPLEIDGNKTEMFLFHDIEPERKDYKLPDLPKGHWIINAFIQKDIVDKMVVDKIK